MIEIVCATKMTESDFWNNSPLALSIKRLAKTVPTTAAIFFSNDRGLPSVYNERINSCAENNDAICVFIHDDVWIEDYFFLDRVVDGLKQYDVIGVAGNRRRVPRQPGWIITEWVAADNVFKEDHYSNLSGSISHANQPFGPVIYFGEVPAECELLDGVFLAARKSALIDKQVFFDSQFYFHFYDLDFCRNARKSGLRLGTWPISLTHKSGGDYNSKEWKEQYFRYIEKWGD